MDSQKFSPPIERDTMKKTHTPGPWHTIADGIFSGTPDPKHLGCYTNSQQVFPFFDSDLKQGMHGQRHVADAKLIAAAPDLLAALQECITDDGARSMIDESRHAASIARNRLDAISSLAREAIDKATK